MKKILLVLIAGFSIATAKAQFKFGVKAGVNRSNITGDVIWGYHAMFNYNAGVFAVLPITKFVSFGPELLYDRKGGQNPEAGVNEWAHESYLDIPLMMRYTDKFRRRCTKKTNSTPTKSIGWSVPVMTSPIHQ
jgi:hypothetical protein